MGFHEWLPAAQKATLGLLTFVREDVPTAGAALLAAAGRLPWQIGFPGVFIGILMGDALLYLLARGVGRPLLKHAWARRFLDPGAVATSERWFAEKGPGFCSAAGSFRAPASRLISRRDSFACRLEDFSQ